MNLLIAEVLNATGKTEEALEQYKLLVPVLDDSAKIRQIYGRSTLYKASVTTKMPKRYTKAQ